MVNCVWFLVERFVVPDVVTFAFGSCVVQVKLSFVTEDTLFGTLTV